MNDRPGAETSGKDEPDEDQKKNLIINYLPPDMQEEELVSIFMPAGPIEQVRIQKNQDGTTKGYGFIRYNNHHDAEKAIQLFDGYQIRGKTLKVAVSRPGGTRENANLFVTHIPAKWTSETLREQFSIFGEVVEARVLEREGASRLCGFVRFNESQDALDALRHRNGWTPPRAHRKLKVTLATKPTRFASKRRSRGHSFRESRSQTDMYSNSIDGSYENSRSKSNPGMGYGYDPSYYHMYHHPTSYPPPPDYRYDYMHARRPSPSYDVHDAPPTPLYKDTRRESFRPQYTYEKKSSSASRSVENIVFVYNLPIIFSLEHIEKLCTKYGMVKDVKVQSDNEGRSLGMAFITFSEHADSHKAYEGLSGCKILDNKIEVEIL